LINQKLFALPQVINEKKTQKVNFFGIEDKHIKKEKVNFLLHILNQIFLLSHLTKIRSLVCWKVSQIRVRSAARNTFAARKTLVAHYKQGKESQDKTGITGQA
jgi:hypothetical protein